MSQEDCLEQGFSPRLSRVAAGVGFLLFLGTLEYFFGPWVTLAIMALPVLIPLLLAMPKSSRKRRILKSVASSVDIGSFFMERLMTVSRVSEND